MQLMQVTESISGSVVFVFVGHVKSLGSLFTGVLLNASNNKEEKTQIKKDKQIKVNIARGTTDPEIDSVTCISCKFGNQMLPLVLVANLTTRWHHLHQLQICPPDGTTCISCTIDHQMAPLVFISCIFGHQVAQFGLVWSSGGTRHQ